ncbi:MAG: hypothetical protein PHV68_04565 [Candidatus Gastranaerophilales bacterium]|nr:hypothetical protein [Candidatus Gastranaerophilales bacterium]
MFRNAWPYLEPSKIYPLMNDLYKNLPEGSLLVVGEFDYSRRNTRSVFETSQFTPVESFYSDIFSSRDTLVFKK